MSYQVIARKWRPQTFEEVTGQEAITRTLRNAVEHERLHHAYLFSGARGVGKTTTARLLAKALNCHKTSKPNPTPCKPDDAEACVSCREIAEGRSIDVLEFDAASNTQVDKIRDLIIENINIAPARDRYKVFIVDEVHMLSTSSFNALLKTLEEPPPRVTFIMATTELHKVPDTILSRCQEFEFRTIPTVKIFERLKLISVAEKVNITDEGLKEIARSGEGSMRDAQSNFDQVISFSGEQIGTDDVITALGLASSEMLGRVMQAVSDKNPKEILAVVEDLVRRGQDLRNFCRDLLSFLRDLLVAKVAGDEESLLESASLSVSELRAFAENFAESDLVRFFNSLSETEESLRKATQERYILEIGLIKLIEMRRVVSLEKILERLALLEKALGSGDFVQNPEKSATVSTSENAAPPNFAPTVEKKTSIVDFSRAEVPFEVGGAKSVVFKEDNQPAKETNQPETETDGSASAETAPIETAANFSPKSNSAVTESAQIESFSAKMPETSPAKTFQPLDADFINSVQIKLPPISAEDLEHIEDNWLDNAYEEKLKREGDNLNAIEAAEEIVVRLLGNASTNYAAQSFQSNGGSAAGFAPAKSNAPPIFVPPNFDDEEESEELVPLSENPSEDELFKYAQNHPTVKRALRIFRGKIISVSKNK